MNVTVQSWNCAVVCCGEAPLVQRRGCLLRKLDGDAAGTEAVMLVVVVVFAAVCYQLKAETKALLLL